MAHVTITDRNYKKYVTPPRGKKMGCVPRDFGKHPIGYLMCAKPFDLPIILKSERYDRWQEQKANKAELTDIRDISGPDGKPIPSRDQNGKGYCWAHSSTSAALLVRASQGEPFADLSAYAVACQIKNFRDEGGWGSESLEWIADKGIPTSTTWPQQSMSRSNVNDAMKADAKLHRFTEWMDLDPSAMEAQLVTCLLMGLPVVSDFNWWSHSVCSVRIVDMDKDGTLKATDIWNSWGDSWSSNGVGTLKGRKCIPDAALCPRTQTPAMA